ncbi:MAG TPA: tRNA 4-thiouridine(8) synthase ThiI [Deltaproteobacteria bacterium]|nr:tRNA 4-thiouridine(8) synthase ThiI [Deltaproteobacteria bacterium]HIJ40235.1 tRNA 4-thiouridine(8) synthase ThiI [Deltaproteobacteria bacterium]HIJ40914.1 tRNA 4-thiouridine(8) synthase ThiI [Deltaproteobacteria bacterium]
MKAICVFSGGLDSMLAASLIRAQDIDVLALFFETPFFTSAKARESSRILDIPFRVADITERHLPIVRNPKHGHGSAMNPCIDCHALMFRIAGEMMEDEGADFIITGEVLGQRPMSQNRRSLTLVESESGMTRLILRPLSAKLLEVTAPEEKGWVNRDLLMDIQGRSRKPQMALARQLNLTAYPSPAGGCLLTEKEFSKKLKDLFAFERNVGPTHLELLKVGRHFRIAPEMKVIVGRNKKENKIIRNLADREDFLIFSISVPGPTILVSGEPSRDQIELACLIAAAYSDANDSDSCDLRIIGKNQEKVATVPVPDKGQFRQYMI